MRIVDMDALIKGIEELIGNIDVYLPVNFIDELAEDYIVDTVPKWIPCEERLPEYFEPVITWDGHCYSVEKRIPYIRDKDGNPIKSEWWVSDDCDEEETDYYPNLRDGAAIAWMPLPEPYMEERKDDETD